jgi:hypothetical protein
MYTYKQHTQSLEFGVQPHNMKLRIEASTSLIYTALSEYETHFFLRK